MYLLAKQTIFKKTILSIILVILFCFTLISCSSTQKTEGTFAEFQEGQQAFSFPGTQWGISVSDLQKNTDLKLGTEPGGTGEITEASESFTGTLYSGPEAVLMDLKCSITYQFQNGHLWAAGVSCDIPENGNEKFEELLVTAREVFGQETESRENETLEIEGVDPGQMFSTYIWKRSDGGQETNAILSAVIKDGIISSMTFDVSYFPNSY